MKAKEVKRGDIYNAEKEKISAFPADTEIFQKTVPKSSKTAIPGIGSRGSDHRNCYFYCPVRAKYCNR